MPIPFKPKVATTNHLLEGDVIYFAHPGWTRDLARATVATTAQDAETLLAAAKAFPLETVGVELMDVDMSTGTPRPTHFRAEFRTKGPSNYFHGRQAENV
jgi:hypothetical protein